MRKSLLLYRGVRFYARTKERGAFVAGVVRFPGQVTPYMTPFDTRSKWAVVELPFNKVSQSASHRHFRYGRGTVSDHRCHGDRIQCGAAITSCETKGWSLLS